MASQYPKQRTVQLFVTEQQLAYLRQLVRLDGGMHADETANYDMLADYFEQEYGELHGPSERFDPVPGYKEE